jgi:hypothetical protein
VRFQRNIYIFIIAIIIYFILIFIYKKITVNNNCTFVYSLIKDVSKGDKILESDLKIIKIFDDSNEKYMSLYNEENCYKNDYCHGTIMLKNMVISNEENLKAKVNNEIISIKLNLPEDSASYQIEKDSIVNIFYSAKLSDVENMFKTLNKSSVMSNDFENAYVTIKLLENIKIINCFDKLGNIIKKGNCIETILVEVSKEESIKISNLKNYGKFSISIIK